ncbi:S-adenosyl-L-methionine-dependent methyltransferase [Zopfochytrium polystomum]|nr:S-adenosyl-L-methionine-dependent methyltransferase [Zopfochytrium polystomum]
MATSKFVVKMAPYPLLTTVAVVPLVLSVLLGVSLSWYPLIALLAALPTFAAYNYWFATIARPVRPQKGLPGKKISDYLVLTDAALNAKYGKSKIPAETFFEAYFDQKIDLPNGADMLDTLEARHDWVSFTFTLNQALFFLTQWIPETLWHSKKQDEDQVREHYDRGDDFYNWFCECTHFTRDGPIIRVVVSNSRRATATSTLAAVGAPSPSTPRRLAPNATGVTLSSNQAAWGRKKAEENGVSDRVEILRMDYRDIPKDRKFNKITCLEMAEHVGVRKFQEFMLQVRDLLEDDGLFFLQIAGLRRAWQYEDLIWGLFMAKYVFPGADASAPLNWVIEQAERAGYEVYTVDTVGVHYSATIYRWYLNWMKNKDKIIDKYGVRWFRIWEVFLAWSTIIARQGSATVYQITLHKNLNGFDRTRFFSRRLKA